MKVLLSTVLGLGLLTGCAGMGVLTGMSEKQIAAMAKIKDAVVVCVKAQGPPLTASGISVFASVDKGISGSVAVSPDCQVQIDTAPKK